FRQRDFLAMLDRRNVIEQRILPRRVGALRKFLQAYASQLRVIIISVAVRYFLVIGASQGGLVVFFGQARPPIERGGGLVAGGIHADLFVKFLFGFFVASKAEREPRRFPVRIRGARALGESLLQFAKCVQSLVVLAVHQVQIRDRQQIRFQPWAGGRRLPQFIDGAVESVVFVRGPGDFAKNIEPLRVLLGGHARQCRQFCLCFTVLAAAFERIGQRQFRRWTGFRRGMEC